ncbi:hypothetical protein ACFLUY_00245 [Chloroflexota bacterium]
MSKRWQLKKATCIVKVGRYTTRLLMAVIVALTLVGFLPTRVQAEDDNPVDLELGGEGATSWHIANMEPGDNGTKLVELHNVGSRAGFVTIWVSEIIDSEGINPESETGDTAEPGELANNLLLDISSNRSSVALKLPATINKLPQSISDPNSIEIIPLGVGDNISIQWEWSLPVLTGNDVQGDAISLDITYLLTEFEITDVSDVVDEETGAFTDNVTVESELDNGKVVIEEDTVGKTKEGEALNEIWLIEMDKEPSAPLEDTASVGAQYDAGPNGSTFDRPITITLAYDPGGLPRRASEEDLVIATWDVDAGKWVELEGSTVDTVNNVVSAPVNHFSRYTILVYVPPPPPPPIEEEEPPSPPPVIIVEKEKEKEAVKPVLRTNVLGDERTVEIEADGTLLKPLSLTDPNDHFLIDVDKGSRITSSDDVPITQIEVTIVEESIAFPGNAVTLSSIYKVTGYIDELEIPRINFDPSARLTILYDPRDLPENAFPPFVANYTEEQGWMRLETPPGSFFEVGKARALIHHASLFAVMAELVPPPLPLPAEFEVSNLTISPRTAQLGKPVIISLTIANESAVTGSYEIYLIINGIVRAVKEITLDGQSIETVSFEVSNLTAGKHQVKIAGLVGEFQIIRAEAALPAEAAFGWIFTDLSVAVIIAMALLALYLIIRRSQRVQYGHYNLDNIIKILRHKNEE